MPASEVPWLGARLRAERLKRGISLRSLAREVGVSASMVSQIETSKSQPSVSTLYAITSALGISIEEVFAPTEPATEPTTEPGLVAVSEPVGAAPAGQPAGEARAAVRTRRRGPVVGPRDRQILTLDSGVTWELLGELPPYPVDFLRVTYPPGSTSSSNGGLMRHPGSEFGFLLTGELVLTLGFEEIRLVADDSISFESRTPHSYRNDSNEPAVGIWFVIEEGD